MIIKNTVYNLLGRVLPLGAAAICIPLIIDGLGIERFGILILVWLIVGYFGIFDLGIGRATTKYVAEARSHNDLDNLPSLVWTSIGMLFCFGVIGGGLLFFLVNPLVENIFNIPDKLLEESRLVFWALAASMPFVLGASGARGVLEGFHKFRLVNIIKVPAGIYSFVAPVGVLLFSDNMFHIALALVFGRVVVFVVHVAVLLRTLPGCWLPCLPKKDTALQLLKFGSWLALSNLVGAAIALGYIDRFMISGILDMSALAYYSTPFEMISKLLFFAAALIGVLFPLFCAYARDNNDQLQTLHLRSIEGMLICLAPLIIVLIVFAEPILTVWLDTTFALKSAFIMQVLCAGVLIQSLGSISVAVIQALGRPDLTAKRHVIQLPFYLLAAWVCVQNFGIGDLALVWTGWVIIDAMMLIQIIRRLIPKQTLGLGLSLVKLTIGIFIVPLVAFPLSTIPDLIMRGMITGIFIAGFTVGCWKFVLDIDDREIFASKFELYRQKLRRQICRSQ